ncbi:MAG: InlB B-repeat-containing protein [Clostridiales bacterium]|nr:InlB B-repeat-containing protein [Clostridiales bacterium]
MHNVKKIINKTICVITALIFLCLPISFARAAQPDDAPELPAIRGVEDINKARVLLFDLDTGAVLYEKNSDVQARPGSLTTIMTSLLLIENTAAEEWDVPLSQLTSVNSSWTGRGAQMGLKKGSTPTRRDLLYGLMLEGAADAAFVTANIVSGGESQFVAAMNAKARELGMENTSFQNVFGLGSGSHYTSAYDLKLLILAAMKESIFREAASAATYNCTQGAGGLAIFNTNPAVGNSGFIGIRSGADSDKEHSLAVGISAGQLSLCAIVLEAPTDRDALSYAERLISAGFSGYAAEGGFSPCLPTNAIIRAKNDSVLTTSAGGSVSVKKGELLRMCGSYENANGEPVFLVYREGSFLWMNGGDAELVEYVNDLFVENGSSLSREMNSGDPKSLDAFVSTRHNVVSCELNVKLITGDTVLVLIRMPNSHGLIRLSEAEMAEAVGSVNIPEGLYICTVTAVAEAKAYGCDIKRFITSTTSILAVGTGGACVSYNANTGESAPLGECFFDSFRVPADTPVKTGWEFKGWNTARDGSGISYAPGDTVASSDSLTLYALWEKPESVYSFDIEVSYDKGLVVLGSIENPAGVTSLRMVVKNKEGVAEERSADCMTEKAELAPLLLFTPLTLDAGDYTIEFYATSEGEERLLLSKELTVTSKEACETPVPTAAPTRAPSDQEPEKEPFSILSIPIFVWFIVGAVVIAGLIALIIVIIKRG